MYPIVDAMSAKARLEHCTTWLVLNRPFLSWLQAQRSNCS